MGGTSEEDNKKDKLKNKTSEKDKLKDKDKTNTVWNDYIKMNPIISQMNEMNEMKEKPEGLHGEKSDDSKSLKKDSHTKEPSKNSQTSPVIIHEDSHDKSEG